MSITRRIARTAATSSWATATTPLSWQSGADRDRQPVLPQRMRILPLRPAGDRLRVDPAAGPARDRMQFASEMVVKATVFGLRIAETPTLLHPDARSRPPHHAADGTAGGFCASWCCSRRVGCSYIPAWRCSPSGFCRCCGCCSHTHRVGNVAFDIHTLLFSALATVVEFQSMMFWVFAKIYRP
jgi:hypothetical protein